MAFVATSASGPEVLSSDRDLFTIETTRTDLSGTNDPVCPSPSIRPSEDSSIPSGSACATKATPTFQRKPSRPKNTSSAVKRPRSAPDALPTRTIFGINCAMNSRMSSPIPELSEDPNIPSDSESSLGQMRSCRPAQIALCPPLGRNRRGHPVAGARKFKASVPRRRRSVILGLSETRISPRRAALPNRIRGRDHLPCSYTTRKLHNIMGITRPKLAMEGEAKQDPTLPTASEPLLADNKKSIESVWNDHDQMQQFSDGYVNVYNGMMTFDHDDNGLSFGDEVMKAINESKPLKRSTISLLNREIGLTAPAAMRSVQQLGNITAAPESSEIPCFGSDLMTTIVPDSTPDHQQANETATSSTHAVTLDSRPTLSPYGWKPRLTKIKSGLTKDLRKERSIDSMTKIETSMGLSSRVPKSPSAVSPRQRLQGKQRRHVRDLSRAKTPSGEPPERPLPKLPTEEEQIRIARRIASSSSNKKSWLVLDATIDDSSPARSSSVASPGNVLYDEVATRSRTDRVARSDAMPNLSDYPAAKPCTRPRRVSTSSSIYSQGSPTLARRRTSTGTITPKERSEKIRELKIKHIATLAKNRSLLKTRLEEANGDSAVTFDLLYNQLLPAGRSKFLSMPPSHRPPNRSPPSSKPMNGVAGGHRIHVRGELADQLDKFPSVPDIRPESRSSALPTTPVQRGLQRSISRANSSCKRRLPTTESDQSVEPTSHPPRRQQRLTQSQIMIICDTDPSTSTFRAGAISPVASVCDINRNLSLNSLNSFRRGRSAQTSRPSSPLVQCAVSSPTKFESIAEVSKPVQPAVTGKKRSLHNLRQQANTARVALTTPVKNSLACISPTAFSRAGPKQLRRQLRLDTDIDSNMHGDRVELIPKRGSSTRRTSKGSAKHRSSRYRSESSSITSVADLSKDMDDLTRVLARFDNKGIKIRGCNLEDVARQVYQRKIDDDMIVASNNGIDDTFFVGDQTSVPARIGVGMHEIDNGDKQGSDGVSINVLMKNTFRTVSAASTITAAGTDTNASASTLQSRLRERASAESSQDTDHRRRHVHGSQDSLTDSVNYSFTKGDTRSIDETLALKQTPQRQNATQADVPTTQTPPSSTSTSSPHSLFIPLGSHPPENYSSLDHSPSQRHSLPMTTTSTVLRSNSQTGSKARSMIHPSGSAVGTISTRPRKSSILLPPFQSEARGSSTTTLNTSSLQMSTINDGFFDLSISDEYKEDADEEDYTINIKGRPWGIPETMLIDTDLNALDPHSRRNSDGNSNQHVSCPIEGNAAKNLIAESSSGLKPRGVDRTSITDPVMHDLLAGMRLWANPNVNLNLGNVQTYDQPYPLFSGFDDDFTKGPSRPLQSQARQPLERSTRTGPSADNTVKSPSDTVQSIYKTDKKHSENDKATGIVENMTESKRPESGPEVRSAVASEGKKTSRNAPTSNKDTSYVGEGVDASPSIPPRSSCPSRPSTSCAPSPALGPQPPIRSSSSSFSTTKTAAAAATEKQAGPEAAGPTTTDSTNRPVPTKPRHKTGTYSSSSIVRSIARVWEERPGGGGRVLHSTNMRRKW